MGRIRTFPEGDRYLECIHAKQKHISELPSLIGHAICSLGALVESHAFMGYSEEVQRTKMLEGITKRIQFRGPELARELVYEFGIQLEDWQYASAVGAYFDKLHEPGLLNFLKRNTIPNITARCQVCSWHYTGELGVEQGSNEVITESTLVAVALYHHEKTRPRNKQAVSQHNLFLLYKGNEIIGSMAASSSATYGELTKTV